MATPLHIHSRLVLWLKILLPILALAVLATLFLFARRIDIDGALPYARVELDKLAADPRLTAPEYSGVTSDGAAVKVAATTARPGKDATSPITAQDVVALYQAASGGKVTIRSKGGTFDSAAALLTLTGDVVVTTADGYQISSDQMLSSLAQSLITADGKVTATAPFGQIDAGAMRLSGPPDAHLLIFNKGVKLIYKPRN